MATPVSFASRLGRWFRAHRRDLPWRSDRTPYRVLVSEIMLQQTTVAAVIPYFERFTARWPDFDSLAEAPEDEVLALWSGLGYYRRARNLRTLARAVTEEHGGEFPADEAAARALPGVGPYTAGAVLSLAHGLPLPAVDGNVGRVLSRWTGRPLLATRVKDRRELESVVLELMPKRAPGAFNEALMELGALACTPLAPECGACPVRGDCRARASGRVAELPPARPRPAPRRVEAAAGFTEHRGRVLLQRRSDDERILPGMWELPGGFSEGDSAAAWLAEAVLPRLGGGSVGERLLSYRHAITHRRITVHVHRIRLDRRPRPGGQLRWATRAEAATLPLTATTASLLERLLPS